MSQSKFMIVIMIIIIIVAAAAAPLEYKIKIEDSLLRKSVSSQIPEIQLEKNSLNLVPIMPKKIHCLL